MQIVDAILFHDEFELLEIRLHELQGVVDRFVIVEADRTFRGQEKPLLFEKERHRFSPFLELIDHYVVDDMPVGSDPWSLEFHQRNAIARAVVSDPADTILLVSDADELPSANAVNRLRANPLLPAGFVQPVHYGWVDLRATAPPSHVEWVGTRAMWAGKQSPQELRNLTDGLASVIRPGGWHFSYLGGEERVSKKLSAYSHAENDRAEVKARFHAALRAGEDPFARPGYSYEHVPASSENLPEYLVEAASRFPHLFLTP